MEMLHLDRTNIPFGQYIYKQVGIVLVTSPINGPALTLVPGCAKKSKSFFLRGLEPDELKIQFKCMGRFASLSES